MDKGLPEESPLPEALNLSDAVPGSPDCLAQSKRRLYGWNTIYFAWKKGIPVDVFPIK